MKKLTEFLKVLVGLLDSPGGHILAGFIMILIGLAANNIASAAGLVASGATMVTMGAKGLNGKGAGVAKDVDNLPK